MDLTTQALTYRSDGGSVEYRHREHSVTLGAGHDRFSSATDAVLRWQVKTRAGFRVVRVGPQGSFSSDGPVTEGECAIIRLGPLRETVRVVRVVDEPRRRGFAYGTLPQHPLRGEEAFLIEWRDDDTVALVIRSFARANGVGWSLPTPLVAIARRVFIRRYQRALLD